MDFLGKKRFCHEIFVGFLLDIFKAIFLIFEQQTKNNKPKTSFRPKGGRELFLFVHAYRLINLTA